MSRRSQIGVLSFLLTLVWAVALFFAFVGGKVGQHPTLAVGLATSGAFCAAASGLLLTLACFPGLAECLRPVAQVAAVGATLDAAAVLWAELPWNARIPDVLNDLEFSNFLLLPSMIALIASSALFFTRWFSNQASRTRFAPLVALPARGDRFSDRPVCRGCGASEIGPGPCPPEPAFNPPLDARGRETRLVDRAGVRHRGGYARPPAWRCVPLAFACVPCLRPLRRARQPGCRVRMVGSDRRGWPKAAGR